MSVLSQGNYVTNDYILSKNNNEISFLKRFCPHRMYPLHNVGDIVNEIACDFHNYKWNKSGVPLNNHKSLKCGKAKAGKSGLIFSNFYEPNHKWVDDLAEEINLKYSHCFLGESKGSWLWLMDAEADYLHVYAKGIHPRLSSIIDVKDVKFDQGDNWILQTHSKDWWSLYVYPYTFIEYKPGCLSVNTVTPKDVNCEFEFKWITQFYFDYDNTTLEDRVEFETLEAVFREDVMAIEKIKGSYFPLMESDNILESHSVHFGKWYLKNVDKK